MVARSSRVKRASKLFADFSGHKVKHARRVKVTMPDVALQVGDCLGILYVPTRDGKREQYLHKFRKSSRPILAASDDGRQLILVGGSYEFTDAGIEDR